MPITTVMAQVAVADYPAALAWYEKLMDRPADRFPMPGLAEWLVTAGGGFQVFDAPERAGQTALVLEVGDIEADRRACLARGLEVSDIASGTSSHFAHLTDPDGNPVVLSQLYAG